MADFFKTADEVTQEFLDAHKEITGIELSINDLGREEVIKFKNYAIAFSTMYSEIQRSDDNTYPGSSDEEGLERHLAARQLPARAQPQPSNGPAKFTGTQQGVSIPAGTIIRKKLDGKLYSTISAVVTPASPFEVTVQCQSVESGANQNIEVESGVQFEITVPIPNISNDVVSEAQFRDGRDLETAAEMLERIQTFDRRTDTGGNLVAYERFARNASPQVVTARALDEPRGPGTVDVVITSGTTDIRSAVENGEAVTRLPSAQLVSDVQAFVEQENPTTDDVLIVGPTEDPFDVTFNFNLFDETLRSSVDVQIRKEIEIFILEARPQDILEPTELERLVDARVGHLIIARRAANFDGATRFKTVPDNKIFIQGIITTGSF